MLRYVFAFFGIKLLMGIALAGASYYVEDIPTSLSTVATIIAASGAIWWFMSRENRRLTTPEIWVFGVGAAVADVVFSLLWLVGMMVILEQPLSWEGIAVVFGGQLDPSEMGGVLVGSFLIGSVQVLFLSAFFAWLLTKQLPEVADNESK